MPIGPSQGGSPAMNLFDLDKMRRQQMAPPPANVGPAPATNGTVQTNPVTVAPSTQSSPATVAPSTASPGVRP
jgi:general secretion pathway protein D